MSSHVPTTTTTARAFAAAAAVAVLLVGASVASVGFVVARAGRTDRANADDDDDEVVPKTVRGGRRRDDDDEEEEEDLRTDDDEGHDDRDRDRDDDVEEDDEDESDSFTSRSRTHVFLVGNCAERPEGRSDVGDVALHRAYAEELGLPSDRLVCLKDDEANVEECERRFEDFLRRSTEGRSDDSLVFYYGGHGSCDGFETSGGRWRHDDVIDAIEKHFGGTHVTMLIDCRCSGNVCLHLRDRDASASSALRCSYLCLASTAPYAEAADPWAMTRCWISSLRRNDALRDAIEIMADAHAEDKKDRMIACVFGKEGGKFDPDKPVRPSELIATPIWRTTLGARFGDWTIEVNRPGGEEDDDDGKEVEGGRREGTRKRDVYRVHRVVMGFGPRRSRRLAREFRRSAASSSSRRRKTAKAKNDTTVLELDDDAAEALPDLLDYVYGTNGAVGGGGSATTTLRRRDEATERAAALLEIDLPVRRDDDERRRGGAQPAATRASRYDVGDDVFYRHPGGPPASVSNGRYLMPGWYCATVVAVHNDDRRRPTQIEVRAEDGIASLSWKAIVADPESDLRDDLELVWRLPDGYEGAQIDLAEQLRYVARSDEATNVPIKVLDAENDELRDAITLDWRDVDDWSDLVRGMDGEDDKEQKTDEKKGRARGVVVGPHTLVRLDGADEPSLVPAGRVVLPGAPELSSPETAAEFADIAANTARDYYTEPRRVLLRGLESSMKTLRDGRDLFDDDDGGEGVSCYWYDDRQWHDAELLDPDDASLEELATAYRYSVEGPYCFIRFRGEDARYVLPLEYVKRRNSGGGD